jgi:hypothetical protein
MSRFICRFVAGRDGRAFSGVWRVWTAKNRPDLYISIRALAGRTKSHSARALSATSGMEKTFSFPHGCQEYRVAGSETGWWSSQAQLERLSARTRDDVGIPRQHSRHFAPKKLVNPLARRLRYRRFHLRTNT